MKVSSLLRREAKEEEAAILHSIFSINLFETTASSEQGAQDAVRAQDAVLSHTEFWRVIFPFKNHSTSPGAGHTGAELWSCLGGWSQLLRHINASGIQLSSPHELGEPSAVPPVLLGADE